MDDSPDALIFQNSPIVTFATNHFINVPVILQFEDTPLLEVVRQVSAGFTTQFSIFHQDGTKLAKVVGSRIHTTAEGEKAGLSLRHPDRMTVCEMNGRTVFEIRREGPAALRTAAELYAPNGAFLKSSDAGLTGRILANSGAALEIGGLSMTENTISGCKIGIRIHRDGRIGICENL